MNKKLETFIRDFLRVDSGQTSVPESTLLQLMDPTSEEAMQFASHLSGGENSEVAAEFSKVLATMLAQNQDAAIRMTDDGYRVDHRDGLGVMGSIADSGATYLTGIGDFSTMESFLSSHDKQMGVGQIVTAAIGLWKADGFAKTLTTIPCTTPVLTFHVPVAEVRTIAAGGKPVNALDVLRDPSIVDGAAEKLRLVPTENLPTNAAGVFPMVPVSDLAAVCDDVAGVSTANHTDVLSSMIELQKIYATLEYNDGTDKTQAVVITIDNGMFSQQVNGSTSERQMSGHFKMLLSDMNSSGFPTAFIPDADSPLEVTVSPNISINIDTRSYKPGGQITIDTAVTDLTGITSAALTVTGFDILVCFAQDNMRRNIYRVDINSLKREYAIPQGTQILVDQAITEKSARGADMIKKATSISRARVDHSALKNGLTTVSVHKRNLDTYSNFPTQMDHPSLNYACAGKSRTAIREVSLDLAETSFLDNSTQRAAVEGRMINLLQGALAEARSESLMHSALLPGEEIVWTLTASAEVSAACLAFPNFQEDDNGVINLGGGVKVKVFETSDITIGEKILVTPRVTGGGENSKLLSFGVMADCGAGFYKYQGGDGGSATNATAIVDRATLIPTNPTAVLITVANRTAKAYSPGGN